MYILFINYPHPPFWYSKFFILFQIVLDLFCIISKFQFLAFYHFQYMKNLGKTNFCAENNWEKRQLANSPFFKFKVLIVDAGYSTFILDCSKVSAFYWEWKKFKKTIYMRRVTYLPPPFSKLEILFYIGHSKFVPYYFKATYVHPCIMYISRIEKKSKLWRAWSWSLLFPTFGSSPSLLYLACIAPKLNLLLCILR